MAISTGVVGTQHTESYSDKTGSDTDFYNGSIIDSDSIQGFENSFTTEWAKWHGIYEDIPIFAAVIDTLAAWAVGKGYKADEKNQEKIRKITGWGKDDFNSIIENLARTCLLAGDSMAEIMRDKAKRLTNLKPLNVGSMKCVVNKHGILKSYNQSVNGEQYGDPFEPKDIFHLCWNRLGDEIHGKPYAKRLLPLIKQIKQLTEDLGLRFHRIVKPVRLYVADTNDESVLTATEVKLKNGWENCEVIVIPKDSLEAQEVMKIPDAKDAIEYLNSLLRQFVSACGVPEVILGWSVGTTDASAKIVYLAFQQRIERIQKFIEEQLRLQLGIELNFEFPASLEPVMETAGDTGQSPSEMKPPVNNSPATDAKKQGKLNNIMKK